MIRGYFRGRHPFVDAVFVFPTFSYEPLKFSLLIDTGTPNIVFTPTHRILEELNDSYGFDTKVLDKGPEVVSPLGNRPTRVIQATLLLADSESNGRAITIPSLQLRIVEPPPDREIRELPPVLGRNVLAHAGLALFMDYRTRQVILLEPDEVDRIIPLL